MRARNIKPGFFKNEDLAECSLFARLLFIGLWGMADREGRLEKRPLRIKAEIFPYDSLDINGELTVLERRRFVQTYSVDGIEYLQILGFKKHQTPHHTEARSKLPEMTEENKVTVNSPLSNGKYPPDSLIHRFTDSLIQETTTATTARETEIVLVDKANSQTKMRDCFLYHYTKLEMLYPHANLPAEMETCIAHYANSPVIDAYPVILKWMNRIPKNDASKSKPSFKDECAEIIERNKEAGRESLRRAIARGER